MQISKQLVQSHTSFTEPSCEEPVNLKHVIRKMTNQMMELQSRVAHLYSNPAFLETHRQLLNKTLPFNALEDMSKSSKFQTRIYGEFSCKRLRDINRIEAYGDINITTVDKRATCPWHLVMDIDKNRIPVNIMKATCTCDSCYRNNGSRGHAGRCEPVETFTPVIRKVCVRGVYVYFVDIESVPLGCTCIRIPHQEKMSVK